MTRLLAGIGVMVAVALVAMLASALVGDRSAAVDLEPATTADTTTTTSWVETQPALPDGFDPARLQPKRAARAKSRHGAPFPTDELLHDLAMCETGGTMDQHALGAGGRYRSFFQWTMWAWRHVGGVGDPIDASYEYQQPLARRLVLELGWSQFPKCSLVIGAR